MDTFTREIANKLLEWGADLVGIAPVERFRDAPEGHKPADFLPDTKSVISVGIHLFQGMADVWGEYNEPGKTITPYLFYGYGLTNIESSRIVNRMAKLLEYRGHKTLCFLPTWLSSSYKYFEEMFETDRVKTEFSHRHAAVAAGIGEFGWSGMVLTPEFGSMQRFNSILTSAELEPTSLYSGPPLCRSEVCEKKCVHICPNGAIAATESQSLSIEGKLYTYACHDNIRCLYGIFGLVKGTGGRSRIAIPEGPLSAQQFFSDLQSNKVNLFDHAMHQNSHGIICGDFCGKCLHQCPSKKVIQKGIKDFDFSQRYSSLASLKAV